MTDPNLVAEVADAVRSAAKIAPTVLIAPETRLVEDLAIDSLDLVGVFLKIQDHFDLAIDDEDVPLLRRVIDLASYVADRRGGAAA
ncbi:MAG TPA: phosphopantetheine-binding protein [Isosphaeraceae bacterium]|jgi:acyl carrier protein|nr:phosphopantetheine-binding protein [Isosphaeraceae bacterium]